MVDTVSPEKRSRIMAAITAKDTKPELTVRRAIHAMGYRFRLHRKDLPGKPDLVLARHKLVVFVHGCFWHQHKGCKIANVPKSRPEYWLPKLRSNTERDIASRAALEELGWRVEVIWECETKDLDRLADRLEAIFKLE